MKKIKIISKDFTTDGNDVEYNIEHYYGITRLRFRKDDEYGWVCPSGYTYDRVLILFIESVIRGLNSNEI